MKNLLRIFVLLFLSGFLAGELFGQEKTNTPPQDTRFGIYVDTAGVAPVPDKAGQYITWIYAKTSDNAPPSAGILVAFDCQQHQVMRVAHIVFALMPDKKSVRGDIVEEVNPQWVPVSNPEVFSLVCEAGAEHAKGNWGPDTKLHTRPPRDDDAPPAPSDPRWRQA